MEYKTQGTCSQMIHLTIENDVITACRFDGGCNGNLQGICRLVVGKNALEVEKELRGIDCRGGTSCPDQLSKAIRAYYK